MATTHSNSVRSLGFWSAAFCTAFSLAYVVAQLAEWAGLLGSAGGPHSKSTSVGLIALLTPSLLLGIAFVVLMVSVHYLAETSARIWSHIAVAFASMYATLISIVYYVQLAFVMPRLASFVGLGLLLFAVTFAIGWLFHTPRQGVGRTFGLVMFVTIAGISNEQTYNFLSAATTALMFLLVPRLSQRPTRSNRFRSACHLPATGCRHHSLLAFPVSEP